MAHPPEYPEKNLSEQGRESTTNSAHFRRRVRESHPGHIGGRRVLSPLRYPCFPHLTRCYIHTFQHTNSFEGSCFSQLSNPHKGRLRLLISLQKKNLYTCKKLTKKPDLEEFVSKLLQQYRMENCGML